jgi:gluconate 2-dehydrogenase subunit 3-like protein
MPDRYPGYDVLAKRDTPSWNEQTRRVIDKRLAIANQPKFLSPQEWQTLLAICDRIVPQPPDRAPIPVAALVDNKLHRNAGDGFRDAKLPPLRQAWRAGLAALDQEARHTHGRLFHKLQDTEKDALLRQAEAGKLRDPAWAGMPPDIFFQGRLMRDILHAYYSHPTAWNEIGFGGPASPRGYVRMGFDRRDPWEAAETKDDVAAARRENARVR